MSILNRKTSTPLVAQLGSKADALRTQESAEAAAQQQYIAAAAAAYDASKTAAVKAAAVEEAQAILINAGVDL